MAYTTIDDPSAHFKVQLYTGTGSSHAVTFDDTDTDMQPDLVWVATRNENEIQPIMNSVSGTGKYLRTNANDGFKYNCRRRHNIIRNWWTIRKYTTHKYTYKNRG